MKYKDPFLKEPLFSLKVSLDIKSINAKLIEIIEEKNISIIFNDSNKIACDCLFKIKGHLQFNLWAKVLIIEVSRNKNCGLINIFGGLDIFRVWSFKKNKIIDIYNFLYEIEEIFKSYIIDISIDYPKLSLTKILPNKK